MRKLIGFVLGLFISVLTFGQPGVGVGAGIVASSGGEAVIPEPAPSTLEDTDSCYAWFQAGDFTTQGDTVVTNWNDDTNNRDMSQATSADMPHYSGDIISVEATNENLSTGLLYNLPQPYYIYGIIRQDSYSSVTTIMEGSIGNMTLNQNGTSPQLAAYGTSYVLQNTNMSMDTWCVVRFFVNGASSSLQINETAASTGDMGTAVPSGWRIGDGGDDGSECSFYELIIMHTDYNEDSIYNYLSTNLPD